MMRRETFWTLVGGMLGALLIITVIAVEWTFGLSQQLFGSVRYRVTASVTLGDHGRVRQSVVSSDCWALATSRGVRQGVRKSRLGEDNHYALGDGSVLILSDLDPCRWVARAPPVSTTLVLAPDGNGRGTLRPDGEAWRFDHARDWQDRPSLAPAKTILNDVNQLQAVRTVWQFPAR